MKFWSKFSAFAVALLFATLTQAQTLTSTGISTSGSAIPGGVITVTVAASNSSAVADYTASTAFSVQFTHLVTGANFTVTSAAVFPTGGLIAKAATNPTTGSNTPGTGTFQFAVTVPISATQAGSYRASVTMTPTGGPTAHTFSQSTAVLTVTGSPDLQITSLTYAASTSRVGGDVIPMQITYRNNSSTNGVTNVPYLPGFSGTPAFVRIQVVLSSNPTYGDADDFQLTILDINTGNITTTDNAGNRAVNADGVEQTFNWQQLLPGNLTGSYYVLAKIDSLNALTENDPPALTVNGNNIWGGNALNPTATLINLLPSNFGTVYLGSHGNGVTTTATGYSDNPSVTADGRYVAFASDATDLVTGDTNAARDIFIFDYQTTLVRRLSLSQQGTASNGASNSPAISGNGRYVAFSSDANNLIIGDTNGFSDIYVVDTITGLISRVSVATAGTQANNPSFRPAISSTGRFIVFESSATNIDTAYTITSGSHIYVHDRDVSGSGVFDTTGNISTRLVDVSSVTPATTVANASSIQATISSDGSTIGFSSRGTNLVAPATTAARQHVYTRARSNVGTATSGIRLISVANTTAAEGGADSQTASLSSTGRYVAFASLATNLVAADSNQVSDIFVYDTAAPVGTPIVRRMSVSTAGVEGYDPSNLGFRLGSINPTISADGRYVAFASLAANLTAGDSIGKFQGSGATATANVAAGTIGSFTVGAGGTQYSQYTPPTVIIMDSTGTGASGTAVVNAAGVITGITVVAGGTGYSATPIVIIASDANAALDIFVRDRDAAATGTFDTGTVATQLVSVNAFGYQTSGLLGVPSTAASNIYPVLSADGRYVAFPSDAENNAGFAFGATNQLPRDSNGVRDIFLFDRRTTASVTPGTPPTVTITSPGNGGSVLVNTPVTVNATATTTIGVVANVQFFVNGTALGAASSVFPYSATWTPTAVGSYTLSALVTDSFGNIGVSSNIAVTVNAAPSVGVTSPVAGASIVVNTGINVTAVAAASNPGATVASVQFFAGGASIGTDVTAPYAITWTPTLPGAYTLTAVATDSIGTQTTSPAVGVTITPVGGGGGPVIIGNAPTVSITSPASSTQLPVNTPALLTATAADSDGNIASVQFFANNVSVGTTSVYPYSASWTPTSLGAYSITARATDNDGNLVTSGAVQVTVADPASTLPTVAIAAPVNASVIPVGNTFTIVATATDTVAVTGVQFFVNGQPQGALVTTFPFSTTWAPLTPGTYTITARAINTGGNQATSAPSTVTVSAGTPPTIALTSPTAGTTVPVGAPQLLRAMATDAVAVANVQFFVNGLAQGPAITAFPFSTPWTPAIPGIYSISARATNAGGTQATSTAISVNVSSGSAPILAITAPTTGTVLPVNTQQTITASALSNGSAVVSVQFFINGVGLSTDTAFPYSATWTPVAVGTYTLQTRATDALGNVTDSAAVGVVVVAGSAPTVAVTNPVAASSYAVGTALNLSATSTDADGIVSGVQFFVNGVAQGAADTSAPYSTLWTPTASGSFLITAQSTDSTGNTTTSAPIAITITSNGAPTVAILGPISGSSASAGTQVTLTATAADADGTVASVRFLTNGTPVGAPATTLPFSTAWSPTAPGNYSIVAEATDNSGNVTSSAPVTVSVIGNQAPTVTLTTPASGSSTPANLPVSLSATAFDLDGSILSVRFLVNGNLVGTPVSTAPYLVAWTPLVTGTYSIVAQATDNFGNLASSAARTVNVVANQPPIANLISPGAGSFSPASVPVTLSATAIDNDGTVTRVRFLVNGNAVGVPVTAAPYTVTWTPLVAGSYTLTAEATDDGGNVAVSSSRVVTIVPNAGPIVLLTSPGAIASAPASIPLTLSASASDSDGTVTRVRFLVNGNIVGLPVTAAPYTVTWTPLVAGSYTITAEATDDAGNVASSAARTIAIVANSGPIVFLTSPGAIASAPAGIPLTLSASAFDNDGTVTRVRFLVNGNLVGLPVTTAPYTVTWTPLLAGSYTITAEATDDAGNVSNAPTRTIAIAPNSAPIVLLTSPGAITSAPASVPLTLSASAFDNDGAVTRVRFLVNGNLVGAPLTAAPYSVSWTPLIAGTYTITAEATDDAGNVGNSAIRAITIVPNAAPVVTLTSPGANASAPANVALTLTATATDNDGTVTRVRFFVNGGIVGTPLTTAPYSVSWTPLIAGSYSIVVEATDDIGNVANSATRVLTVVPNALPIATITTPVTGFSTMLGLSVNLTAVASDSDGTVSQVRFLANGTSVGPAVTTAPYTATWTPTAAGTYSVIAQATDSVGNVGNSTSIAVTVVNNNLPTLALTAPGNGTVVRVGSSNLLAAIAADSDGTIASVQFFVNGAAQGPAVTAFPYRGTWVPGAEGIYRITATAIDNAGASRSSSVSTVLVTAQATVGDSVATGLIVGSNENGNFAAINARGKTATFIGISTVDGVSKTYFHSGMTMGVNGSFSSTNAAGDSLINGSFSETGAFGALDDNRISFSGIVAFPGAVTTIAPGYYTGSISGRMASTVAAIIGADGSVAIYVSDGTFVAAGLGAVDATGGFEIILNSPGTRIVGKADPASGFLTGTIVGGPGGSIMAATGAGASISDGFLRNLSTRGQVGTGANILIAGFVVGGTTPKQVMVRAVGPALGQFGVAGSLGDPQLQLLNGSTVVAQNDNWEMPIGINIPGAAAISAAAGSVGAFGLPAGSRDSVVLTTLSPGNYTAQVSGVGGGTGIALVEVWDVDNPSPFSPQKVMNVSTRGIVGTNQGQLIAGFVVSGNTPKKVLIRGVGPSLATVGITSGFLADPVLRLTRRVDVVDSSVRENDNWQVGNDSAQVVEIAARVGAFALTPGSRDAVILINLPPGIYTAQVTGAGSTTGMALVEVYEVP